MMMKSNYMFSILLLMVNTCYAQNEALVEGIVEFTYAKDTIGQDDSFWLTEKKINGFYLVEDYSEIAGQIFMSCPNYSVAKTKKGNKVYDLSQYQSQTRKSDDYYEFVGGDTYTNDEGQIIISFFLKANVVIFQEQPCSSFLFQSIYKCPVERQKVTYPVYAISQILEAKSLDSSLVKSKGLRKFNSESFIRGICD